MLYVRARSQFLKKDIKDSCWSSKINFVEAIIQIALKSPKDLSFSNNSQGSFSYCFKKEDLLLVPNSIGRIFLQIVKCNIMVDNIIALQAWKSIKQNFLPRTCNQHRTISRRKQYY